MLKGRSSGKSQSTVVACADFVSDVRLPPKLVRKGTDLIRYPNPRVSSFPLVSVRRLLSRLNPIARSFLISVVNWKLFLSSKSTLISGLNCSTKLTFVYNVSLRKLPP